MSSNESILLSHFISIQDPRLIAKHKFSDILVLAICATLCGAEHWTEVETFGKFREEWLSSFLELPNGIPSHDTFSRVFSLLNPRRFEECFLNWMQEVLQELREKEGLFEKQVVIDGKALRGTSKKKSSMIQTLNAWGRSTGLILGQRVIEKGTNEITALPDFLKELQLKGSLVTLDAMGCQKKLVGEIAEQEADYIIALKKNQPSMYSQVEAYFQEQTELDFADLDSFSTSEKGHGRTERRFYWMTDQLDWLKGREEWEELRSVGFVLSERERKGKTTTEVRFFLSSLDSDVENFARSVRGHWEIENKLHWVLDVIFREDDCRIRTGYGAENFALLRKIALNLLRQDDHKFKSIKGRRKMAGWSTDYLLKLLNSL